MDTKDLIFWCLNISQAVVATFIILLSLLYWPPGQLFIYRSIEMIWWIREVAVNLF